MKIKSGLVGVVVSTLKKYARQIVSFPSSGGENKKYLKPPPTLR